MGGGGFSDGGSGLDGYVLELTGADRPRACFVPTASGDSESYIENFLAAYSQRADASVLRLFAREIDDLRAHLLSQHLIYVGGGNTANMLAVWRLHGVDEMMREAWSAGVILCGLSAGANCWFEASSTDSFGPTLAPLDDGLALLPGSFCPHYDSEPERRPSYRAAVAGGELPPGFAADDGVALRFAGRALAEAVSERPGAVAHRVEAASETVLAPRLLAPGG
ncbi:MAG: dipeptidase [Gaiellales bacterium]|jgi:peptidase E|nr:dipeptidase [Gaiellales bacterium]